MPTNLMVSHYSSCNWVVCRMFVTNRIYPPLAMCDTKCCYQIRCNQDRLLHIIGSKKGSCYGHQWLLTLQAAKKSGQKK